MSTTNPEMERRLLAIEAKVQSLLSPNPLVGKPPLVKAVDFLKSVASTLVRSKDEARMKRVISSLERILFLGNRVVDWHPLSPSCECEGCKALKELAQEIDNFRTNV